MAEVLKWKKQSRAPRWFKAKTLTGEWVEGYLVDMMENMERICYIQGSTKSLQWDVDPDTICVWTGVKDKNGTRIFEGDILHVFEVREDYETKELKESDWYTDVVWEQDCTCFLVCAGRDMEQRITQVIGAHNVEQGYCDPFTDFGPKGRPAWEYEVVGNIYNDEDFRKYAQNVLYIKEYNKYKTEKQKVIKYCMKFEKEVKLLDCLACYFSKHRGKRKGPGTCGFCKTKGGISESKLSNKRR